MKTKPNGTKKQLFKLQNSFDINESFSKTLTPILKNPICTIKKLGCNENCKCKNKININNINIGQDIEYNYRFKGVQFGIYRLKPKFINFSVEIDHNHIFEIIYNENKEQKDKLLFISPELKYEYHTIRVICNCEHFKQLKLVYWPSLKAHKIEWNDLSKSGDWIEEKNKKGEIRYKTTKNGGSITIKSQINRFWLYGICNDEKNEISLIKENFSVKNLMLSSKKDEEDMLVYESPIMNISNSPLIISISGKFTFYYLYCEFHLKNAEIKDFNSKNDQNFDIIKSSSNIYSTNENILSSTIQFSSKKVDSKKCQNQISIKNCKFQKMTSINTENNAFFISTKDDKTEEIIEDNYFESCGDSGYVYTVESKISIMRNNTFNFEKTENLCGAFNIPQKGNITITDCHFIKMNKSGIINYNPVNQGNEGDFLLISDCSFQECNGLCCKIDVKENSKEKITITDCKFIKCQKGGDDSIAILTSETADSIKLFILNNNFTDCGKDNENENNYIFNLQINQPTKNEEYLIFEENFFYNSCGFIKIKQQEGQFVIRKCNIKKINQNSILVDLLKDVLIEECSFDNCNCCFSVEKSISNANIENCNFSNCFNDIGKGGAFSINNPTDNKIELFFKSCIFINNTASDCGGAISVQSFQSIIIINCEFTNNQASNGGGSIFISNEMSIESIMSNVTISNCNFISNKDCSNEGHAILIKQNSNILIDQNCLFIDNGDLVNNTFKGYTIVSESQYFEFKDSIIEFSDLHHSTSALFLNNSESSIINNVTFKRICSDDLFESKVENNFYLIYISFTVKNAEINNCLFDECCTSSTKNVIFDDGKYTIINNCNFLNTDNESFSSGAVTINSIGTHVISNCYVKNGMNEIGLFKYHPQNESENDKIDQIFTFFNNTIDGLKGDPSQDKIALNFYFQQFDQLSIDNVTIKNIIFSKVGIVCINLSDNMTDFSVNNFQFLNNKIVDNTINVSDILFHNFIGKLSDSEYEFTFNECKWINNSCNTIYGGEMGLWLFNNKKGINFLFNKCLFESNFNIKSGGGFQDGSSVAIFEKSLHFLSCIFNDNEAIEKGGGLIIQTVFPFKIDGCKFNNNKAKSGGSIYIETTYQDKTSNKTLFADHGTISNCEFKNNIANDGIIFCINNSLYTRIDFDGTNNITNRGESGSMIYSECYEIILTDVVFDFDPINYIKAEFLAVSIESGNTSVFSNCTFNKVSNTEKFYAHAIFINKIYKAIFDGCIFMDCGDNNDEYVIQVSAMSSRYVVTFEFLSCIINFTNPQFSAGGIQTNFALIFTIINSTFKNCHKKGNDQTGGIIFNKYKSSMCSSCPATITGCIFDNFIAGYGRVMNFNIAIYLIISKCTIKNMPNGDYLIVINPISYQVQKIVLDNVIFIDNKVSCSNYQGVDTGGGGIGIYLSRISNFIFQDCKFIRNTNMKKSNGGVLGYCPNNTPNSMVSLQFINCYFEDNMVQEGYNGSALYIKSRVDPVLIDSCTFINKITNTANYGGVIYIDGKTNKNVTIINCNFIQSKATSKNKYSGNAIYIGYEVTDVYIIGCYFNNCGGNGSAISFYGNRNIKKFGTYLIIESCIFEENKIMNGIFLYLDGELDYLLINRCIFDGLNGIENGCLFLSIYSDTFIFTNNILKNINSQVPSDRICKIDCHDLIQSFVILNMSFVNNSCNCLYGGGIGFTFEGINKLIFHECTFINNKAIQDKTISRPIDDSTHRYYNGDGGGIQVGYLCSNIYTSVTFDSCIFKENKSKRHGGAIAIQTISTIKIINCTFNNNIANYQLETFSLDLLYDDHFYSHQEGKGGSIYINPSFKTEPLKCDKQTKTFISSVLIEKCTFNSNKGFNGSSIYLAGEDHGTTIIITKNNFIYDIDESNQSIILTEICVISPKQIIDENNFSNPKVELKEKNILATNCKYISSEKFTKSSIFSKSREFTSSQIFSDSKIILESSAFTKSQTFSDSDEFSNSFEFSNSEKFTKSFYFSESKELSIDDSYNVPPKKALSFKQLIGIICGVVLVILLMIGIFIIILIKRKEKRKNSNIDSEITSVSSSRIPQRSFEMSLSNASVNNNIGSNPEDQLEILI